MRSLVTAKNSETDRPIISSRSRRPVQAAWGAATTLAYSRSAPLRPSAVPVRRPTGGLSNGLTSMPLFGGTGKGYGGPAPRSMAGLDPAAPEPEAAAEAREPVGGADDPATTAAAPSSSPSASAPTALGGLDISDWKVSGPSWSPGTELSIGGSGSVPAATPAG